MVHSLLKFRYFLQSVRFHHRLEDEAPDAFVEGAEEAEGDCLDGRSDSSFDRFRELESEMGAVRLRLEGMIEAEMSGKTERSCGDHHPVSTGCMFTI